MQHHRDGRPRRRAFVRANVLTVAAALAPGALAQTAAPPPAEEPQPLNPVVVTATRTERRLVDVPASVELIERDTIRDAQLRVNLSESLAQVPGVVVLNRQNYAQDLQISIRGFGARSTFGIRGVRLYVDGVPASFPDGQGQVSHFSLNAADRIEVLRGPFSALYGNSSGGVISFTTLLKPQAPVFEPTAAYGSNNTWRVGFSGTGGDQQNAFLVDAGRFHTDGERDHSEAQRDTATIRTAFLDSPLGEVRLSLNALSMPGAQDPLGLTRNQMQLDPKAASPQALQFDTRKSTRQGTAGAEIRSHIAADTTLTTSIWIGRRGVTQYQAIPVAAQLPSSSPGGVIDFDRRFGGGDLRATFDTGPVTTNVGIDVEAMDEDRRGYENFIGTTLGVKGGLRRDEVNRVDSVDPYVQAEWRIGDAWQLHAGARASEVRFESKDHYLVNGDDSGSISYSAVNPTVGLVFKPFQAMSVYASYGRGFETPTLTELAYRPDGSAGINTSLHAARSNNFEVGVKNLWTPRMRTTLALFSIRTDDEIVVVANSAGRAAYANATRTARDGVEAEFEWEPVEALTLIASAAAINARFTDDFYQCSTTGCAVPNVLVPAGNKLPAVPARTAYLEARYRNPLADVSLAFRAQSLMYVNNANADRAAGYGVVNLAFARTFQVGSTKPRGFFRIDNLLDRNYVGSVIVEETSGRFFEPAPERTLLVGVDWPL
ncbi:MAG TPA: TonB-dependent receptor [Burkholderiaceae bacterium]|nr:TonB-dependent receptor [Burkholderiaceae bacterium]